MKRIVVLLSAILLIFAVACSGDTPAPGGGSGTTGSDLMPAADKEMGYDLYAKVMTALSGPGDDANPPEIPVYNRQEAFDNRGRKLATLDLDTSNSYNGSLTVLVDYESLSSGSVYEVAIYGSTITVFSRNDSPLEGIEARTAEEDLSALLRGSALVIGETRYEFEGRTYGDVKYDRVVCTRIQKMTPEIKVDAIECVFSPATNDGMSKIAAYAAYDMNNELLNSVYVIEGGAYAGSYNAPSGALAQMN